MVLGLEPRRRPVQARGLGIAARLVLDGAQVAQHAVARRDPQRVPEGRFGVVPAAGGQVHAAQPVPGLDLPGLQLRRLAIGLDRIVDVAVGVLQVADLALNLAVAGPHGQAEHGKGSWRETVWYYG